MATAVYGLGKPVASLGFLGWGRQSRRLDGRRYRQNGEHRSAKRADSGLYQRILASPSC
jgi:hypothetical protein